MYEMSAIKIRLSGKLGKKFRLSGNVCRKPLPDESSKKGVPVVVVALSDSSGPQREMSSLRYCRLQRGWSQNEVVEQLQRLIEEDGDMRGGLGLCESTISRWELGSRRPAMYYRKYLCRLYGLNAFELGIG